MKYLLFLLLALSPVLALNIEHDDISYDKFPLEIFFDKSNALTHETIQSAPFEPSLSKRSFGYKKKETFWVRSELTNSSGKDQTLYLYHKDGYTYLDVVFYEFQNGKLLNQVSLGRNIPLEEKTIKDASPVYILQLKKGETKTVYIKNLSKSTLLFNLEVFDSEHYHRANLIKNAYYLFFFGIVAALLLYNLVLYVTMRAIEYLDYVVFIGGSIFYLLYVSGIPLEFFGAYDESYTAFLYGIPILQIALIRFSQKILQTKEFLPRVHLYLDILIGINIFYLLIALLTSINYLLSIFSATALVVAFSLLIVGFAGLRKKIEAALYFLYSIGAYLVFALIGIFTYFGILPYTDFTRHALFLASLSEVFLLSLLLSHRISLLKAWAIESERKLNKEIKKRNDILENQVKERTEELQILNSNLEARVQHSLEEIRKKDENLMYQSRMAMMGEMLSMIAHQWRQPLSSIASVRNNMEIEIKLDEMEKEGLLEQLEKIDKYIQFMSKTIDDFRSFFKPEKSKNFVNLADVIADTITIVSPSLKQHEIAITLNMSTTPKIYTFKNELIQVILNLIKNAQDAYADKAIKNRKIAISLEQEGAIQSITVEDNAGGIPDAIVEKIFNPYFSTKEDKNGTGLGLYMSRIIVEEHCFGTINVSNTDKGAKFVIAFDLAKVESSNR